MTETLSNLTYRVARELGIVTWGTATGGAVGTLIDTNDRTEVDDYWNGGTLWLLRDAGGASAAPEGELQVVSDFANSTKTVTFRSNMTVAPATGDNYAIADKRFPFSTLVQVVNMALQDAGRIPVVDTSITIADNQTEYTLPAAIYPDNLKRVFVQIEKNDSNDNQWQELFNWWIDVTATGTADTLILPYQWASGYKLRLEYIALHPQLNLYSDKLSETVPIERVIYQAAYLALKWWKDKYKQDTYNDAIQMMQAKAVEMSRTYPIKRPRKPSRIVNLADMFDREYDSEPNKVYL